MNERVQELLEQWESLREQGQDVSVDDLCRDCPDLVNELRRRVTALKATEWLNDSSGDESESDEAPTLPPTLGRYRLDSLIGQGGYGQVWKGFDPELGRSVAIKVPRSKIFSDEQARRFLEEGRRVAQLQHPGIVSVHDVGRDGDFVFIVSELIDGESLSEKKRLQIEEAVWLVAELAEILQHAHENGFVHRDIKPANVVIDRQGRPHLTDFGIAATFEELKQPIPSVGTLAYMSPEQLAGDQADVRSDVWSLGVVFYELMTGCRPFQARTAAEMSQQFSCSPSYDGLPKELASICRKCLALNPADRYASAAEVAKDLESSVVSRKRWSGWLIAAALVVVAGGIVWWRSHGLQPVAKVADPGDHKPVTESNQPDVETSVELSLAKGKVLLNQRSYKQALEQFNEVLKLDARSVEALHRRAVCYYNLGEFDKALVDLDAAFEIGPENAELRKNRSLTLLKLKRFDDGIAEANESLRLAPESEKLQYRSTVGTAYVARAADHSTKKRLTESLADLNEAIRVCPERAESFHQRGNYFYNQKQFDKAISDYEEAIRLDSTKPEYLSHLASAQKGRVLGLVKEIEADARRDEGKK